VCHLPNRVYADIGAARDRETRWSAVLAEDRVEGGFELPLDGAEARLSRPAGEIRAVVCKVDPKAHPFAPLVLIGHLGDSRHAGDSRVAGTLGRWSSDR
jgi:hypothetical protein